MQKPAFYFGRFFYFPLIPLAGEIIPCTIYTLQYINRNPILAHLQ